MKKLMISLAALAAIGSAVPAAAQSWGGYGNGYGYGYGYSRTNDDYARMNARFFSVSRRIDTAENHGQITTAQANRLRSELRNIALEATQFGRDGLDGRENARVIARLQRVSERMDAFRYRAPSRYADRYVPSYYGDHDWRD